LEARSDPCRRCADRADADRVLHLFAVDDLIHVVATLASPTSTCPIATRPGGWTVGSDLSR
jgi:hypothetical protein